MTDLYNRTPLEPHTRANADDVNNETAKIASAITQLTLMVQALQEGGGSGDGVARYTWIAFADSSDGTVNFSHTPGNRAYLGVAANKLIDTPSDFPEDYSWALIRGSDAPTLRLVSSAQRFDFDSDGVSTGASEILFTAEGTNLATAIQFSAKNDSGSVVTLATVNADQVKLDVADFGEADWVQVTALANGGAVSDSIVVTAKRDTRQVNYKGRWRPDVTYAKQDVVTYRGSSFISLTDTNLNHMPDIHGEDNAYWDAMAVGGAVGDPSTPDTAPNTTITLTSSVERVNLRALASVAGYRGKANATYTFVVPNGVTIVGRPIGGARSIHETGGIAIDTGEWPVDEHTITLVLTVQSGGVVRGGGGDGGRGGIRGGSGGKGNNGGDAIFCRVPMTVNIDAGGKVESGGGGGSGADSSTTGWPLSSHSDTGGGGGGFPNGRAGNGGGAGAAGLDGTAAGGGLGGAPGGGNGGNAGASPTNGGTAGYAVRKNGNTVTVNNSGTMTGTAA